MFDWFKGDKVSEAEFWKQKGYELVQKLGTPEEKAQAMQRREQLSALNHERLLELFKGAA